MTDDLEIRELKSDEILESIHERVLVPNFASDELEPLGTLRGLLEASPPEAFGVYALDPSREPIGCCIYYPYPDERTLLLGYMGVVSSGRSRHVGTRLFETSKKWFDPDLYDLVVVELDDPRAYPVENGIDPERRINFYSKLGCRLICGPYFSPCVRPGGERVYDVLLGVLGGSPRAVHDSSQSVSVEFVAAWLQEYFSVEDGLGEFNKDDLDWLLAAYAGSGTVDLVPVADYRSWDPPTVPSRHT
jgi:hypothetical protein